MKDLGLEADHPNRKLLAWINFRSQNKDIGEIYTGMTTNIYRIAI